ncbi:unnamed protein product [Sphagnum balticum]
MTFLAALASKDTRDKAGRKKSLAVLTAGKVDDITVLTGNVAIAETILKPIPRAASAGLVDLSVDTTAGTRCGASK